VDAYQKAGYRAKEPHKRACEIRAIPGVARFIAELRKPRENAAVLTLEMKRAFLRDVVRTPVGSIAPGDALAQEFRTTKDGMLVKMPCKLRAIELDAVDCGVAVVT